MVNEPLTKDEFQERGGQARKEVGSPELLPAPLTKDKMVYPVCENCQFRSDGIRLRKSNCTGFLYESDEVASAVRLLREKILSEEPNDYGAHICSLIDEVFEGVGK